MNEEEKALLEKGISSIDNFIKNHNIIQNVEDFRQELICQILEEIKMKNPEQVRISQFVQKAGKNIINNSHNSLGNDFQWVKNPETKLKEAVLPKEEVKFLSRKKEDIEEININNAITLEAINDIDLDDYVEQSIKVENLRKILNTLTPKEEKVLKLRFGLEDGKLRPFWEVGREFDLSRERIRQIEAKALRKLRHPDKVKLLNEINPKFNPYKIKKEQELIKEKEEEERKRKIEQRAVNNEMVLKQLDEKYTITIDKKIYHYNYVEKKFGTIVYDDIWYATFVEELDDNILKILEYKKKEKDLFILKKEEEKTLKRILSLGREVNNIYQYRKQNGIKKADYYFNSLKCERNSLIKKRNNLEKRINKLSEEIICLENF